ncbi:peptidylprolyl isomerase [Breznakiellaceae bacterium SP9]
MKIFIIIGALKKQKNLNLRLTACAFILALMCCCAESATAGPSSSKPAVPDRSDSKETATAPAASKLGDGLFARISTRRGDIVVRLAFEKTPLTVCNFVGLAEGKLDAAKGTPFYNGLVFHRVIADFMIQGGDPLGNGTGGPGYQFPDEFDSSLRHNRGGILSMANSGPGTNGSQFFITHKETPWLDGKHTVFGSVVAGQDVVNAIKQGDTIISITIERNGTAANNFIADQAAFDSLLRQTQQAAAAQGKAKRDADIAAIKAKYPDLTETASGLQYVIQTEGKGNKAAAGKTIQVSYKGMFLSGEVFDSSDVHGGPIEVTAGAGRMIPGFEQTFLDMKLGEKRLVVIPPELAYGARAVGPIPANSFLVFEMELVSIK